MMLPERNADTKSDARPGIRNGTSEGVTIFVIDDHAIMRDAIASLLRRLRPDARIIELARLAELEPTTQAHSRPMVILLDLNLPDAEGCSGVRQIKQSYPETSLAVYSALPALDMEHQCIEAGADLYIEKTADIRSLGAALRSLLTTS